MNMSVKPTVKCYHCGEECINETIQLADKNFCCQGCKTVYQVLNQSDLCDYYELNQNPGTSQRISVRKDKFSFLDDEKIEQQLISFRNTEQTHITFYLPQIHCSSCLWLLENLHRLNAAVISSRVNFTRKEVAIVFDHRSTSLRSVAELLTSIGYEPYISLQNLQQAKPRIQRSLIYQLGVAGFCFANIMLMSFPEYLGLEEAEKSMQSLFRYFNLILAIPVFLYSSLPFYQSAWGSLKHKYLNIDAPIALAIIMTFGRSLYEVLSNTGGGYFDSMSGIVFFMLVGRVLQEKTYQQLSFERDYTSYFPIAVTVLKDKKEIPTALPDIKAGDTILLHNEELIPVDGLLTKGKAFIDYSFVTGESLPVLKEMGELLYAGGKQTGGNIEMLVMKEVSQSYLTRLWNNGEKAKPEKISFVDGLSRYFTWIVFALAAIGALYWSFYDGGKAWNVVTTILIVACPCALLLSNSFTNGNVLRILSKNKLYLRNAQTIEEMAKAIHLVFDKTGTLTTTEEQEIAYTGEPFNDEIAGSVAAVAAQSTHPLSKLLAKELRTNETYEVRQFSETTGRGISGIVNHRIITLGSAEFVTGEEVTVFNGSSVYVSVDGILFGHFCIRNHYRPSIFQQIGELRKQYRISILSGDNESERLKLQQELGMDVKLFFNQQPHDKLNYIKQLQEKGQKVIMIGDGLNDAGALKQSDAGIAVTESTNNFTPASDGILEADRLSRLSSYLLFTKANKQVVIASFVLSIVYNIIGLTFALQGILSPLVAAILMPSSSISIILLTFGASSLYARFLRLN
ncbi:heavy metal translocating P-type ATPase [Lacibacter sediminis]|uniref:Heavy metal translocating P-type ATPase metal-binding domain-containing protein n=1 Tax=Lacibacter sediminis TaxID=2760713 RepID=A0A7G5XJA3_9BACT|nr:heavy metal translocating P-type ATPase metal-binding domain-containing protein [Lacibacter sediminis]QNA45556.1 heavy metal translocating P-type ATPase metal-binding domain-containing protein [Lacibacter sediminis]